VALRIDLLTVGRPRNRTLAALHDDYAARIVRLGVRYAARHVPEVRLTGSTSVEHVKEREARSLLASIGSKGVHVALDPGGDLVTSDALARKLARLAERGATLAVGGPLGLHRSVLDRAAWVWSLSPLTFPHELVRVLVVEQVYRAVTIARGVPYHK
jgi:23S rRNA (pseudouridine1915-N3)-methyltransferase